MSVTLYMPFPALNLYPWNTAQEINFNIDTKVHCIALQAFNSDLFYIL